MTLRTRLAFLSALILAVAVGVVGVVVAQTVRASLLAPIDDRLTRLGGELTRTTSPSADSSSTDPSPTDPGRGPGPGDPAAFGDRGARPEGRDTALLRFVDGVRDVAVPSGFDSDPDPLPEITASIADGMDAGEWRLVDVSSADGTLDFRAVVIVSDGVPAPFDNDPQSSEIGDDQRVVQVFARPLDTVDATTDRLRWTTLVAALGALAVGWSLTWLVVRRSFRPVEEAVQVAEQIRDGDLSLRVPEPDQPAELRSLGRSINSMLDGIETARRSETAAQAALSQFVADASHELRTPIAAISGHAELIGAAGLDDETRERSLGRISGETARMQRLVDDLLTLASHDTGHRRPHRAVNLSDVVGDAVEDARAIDPERTYVAEIEPGVRVSGDEAQLLQIVANLLANVRIHTSEGTTCTVTVARHARAATVSVTDDGPGIPEAHRARLFERFFRAGAASSTTRSGAGLGLAIVSALVDEHGGTVAVRTGAASGAGTSFLVELPTVEPAVPEEHRE